MLDENIIYEMQKIINHLIDNGNFTEALESIRLYEKSIGETDFSKEKKEQVQLYIHSKISLICIDCPDDYIEVFISDQHLIDFEIVKWSSYEDSVEDLIHYIQNCNADFLTFIETNQLYSDKKLFDGNVLLDFAISSQINIYGNLSCFMLNKSAYRKIKCIHYETTCTEIKKIILLYSLLLLDGVSIWEKVYVSTFCQPADLFHKEYLEKVDNEYKQFIDFMFQNKLCQAKSNVVHSLPFDKEQTWHSKSLLPEITLFYTDLGELYNLKPIGDAAQKRGFQVTQSVTI